MEKFDCIIVGGGASGMMACGRLAERGLRVLLLEKNKKLGEKLRISGGGRCNITNGEKDIHKFVATYGKKGKFLYSIYDQFSPADTFKFFEERGLPLVIQARARAFPNTERAEDVVKVMENYAVNGKVTIKTGSPVTRIHFENNLITGISCGKNLYTAKEYIFATGGVSHPETGSTGDGFRWLAELGHNIAEPTPSIVPLATKENWSHELAGVSLSFMKITFFVEGKKVFSKTGKILFTHFGLSGPLILNLATKVSDLLYDGQVTATIDAYPDTDLGAMDKKLVIIFDNNKNKILKNIIKEFTPEGTHKGISNLLKNKIDLEKKVHSVSKDERKMIGHLLKALPLTINGLMGFDRAVIADGGVPLEEIDMRTMRSLKVKNLFITGDLLHINRPSGGFSLQLIWSTGYVAGSNIGLK